MSIESIVNLFLNRPYMKKQGNSFIAKRLKVPVEDVKKARQIFRNRISNVTNNKILILDIETSPMKAYVWKRWKENVSLDQTISEWFMICWSAKWLGSDYTMYDCVTTEEILKEDDHRILGSLYQLLNEASVVIAHNGKKFDIPKINSRLILAGYPPPTPYKQIDTKEVAKRQFGFSSNKLDALATYFGIENKDDTDFNLWKRCLEGEQEALDYMTKYNIKDVEILEKVYVKLRPWISNHPNVNLLASSEMICPCCGSSHIQCIEDATYDTNVSKFPVYRCENCGAISRDRKSINNKPKVVSAVCQ